MGHGRPAGPAARLARPGQHGVGQHGGQRASTVDVRTADGQPTWLSTDGEVAIAESRFVHGKHPHALVVYRKADG